MNKCDVCKKEAVTFAMDSLKVTDMGYTMYAPLFETRRYRCEEHYEEPQTIELKYPNEYTKQWNPRRNNGKSIQ